MRCVLLLVTLGCRLPPSDIPDDALDDLPPPSLTSLAWGCDGDQARWELLADTRSWTAGGRLWLTEDARYVEEHEVRSIGAAVDGSTDRVRVRLDVEPDWRLVVAGTSTAFSCTTPPDGLLVVFGRDGLVADCAWLGPGTAWRQIDGLPACDEPFAE
jgi:hypothetical protein